jgi:hypothetical protein
MRFQRFALLALLFTCGCSVIRTRNKNNQSIEAQKPTYFVSIPITQFSSFQTPCINVTIEENTFLLKLDLGFQGDMTIAKEAVDLISSKTFLGEKSMYGVRGKEYTKKIYQIPRAKIGAMAFSPPILQEENEQFLKDAEFLQNEENSSLREEKGRLGWELFCNTNLLIDVKNSHIAFFDSLDTLKKEGYAVETFIRSSLFLERGLIELETNTPDGPLRCVLDTGTTWNVLNVDFERDKSIDTAVWEPENILAYLFFNIGGVDFGPTSFHRIPIQTPIRIEAILGIEFFKNHLIVLDFAGRAVYFQKTPG